MTSAKIKRAMLLTVVGFVGVGSASVVISSEEDSSSKKAPMCKTTLQKEQSAKKTSDCPPCPACP